MHTIGEKKPEWAIEEISNERFALNHHGITVRVFYSREELEEWLKIRFPGRSVESHVEVLDRAIRRL